MNGLRKRSQLIVDKLFSMQIRCIDRCSRSSAINTRKPAVLSMTGAAQRPRHAVAQSMGQSPKEMELKSGRQPLGKSVFVVGFDGVERLGAAEALISQTLMAPFVEAIVPEVNLEAGWLLLTRPFPKGIRDQLACKRCKPGT